MLCKNHPTQLCQNVYSEGWNMLVWRMRHICTGLQAFQVLDVTTDLNFVKVFQSHASCPGKMSRLIWSQWFTKHEKCCIHKGISSLKKNWWKGGGSKETWFAQETSAFAPIFFPHCAQDLWKTWKRSLNVIFPLKCKTWNMNHLSSCISTHYMNQSSHMQHMIQFFHSDKSLCYFHWPCSSLHKNKRFWSKTLEPISLRKSQAAYWNAVTIHLPLLLHILNVSDYTKVVFS